MASGEGAAAAGLAEPKETASIGHERRRFPKTERPRGLRRNIKDPAPDVRPPIDDFHSRAAAVVEVEDPNLRPLGQAAMRRGQPAGTGWVIVGGQALFGRRGVAAKAKAIAQAMRAFRIFVVLLRPPAASAFEIRGTFGGPTRRPLPQFRIA